MRLKANTRHRGQKAAASPKLVTADAIDFLRNVTKEELDMAYNYYKMVISVQWIPVNRDSVKGYFRLIVIYIGKPFTK